MTIGIPCGRIPRRNSLCNTFCMCDETDPITPVSNHIETGPSTPTPTVPVRATPTRFKQYLSRAIEERQMVHKRLMLNPKSAPSRKRQNGWVQSARKSGRATKLFKYQQEVDECMVLPSELDDCLVLPPLGVKALPTRNQIKQAAVDRLRRFVSFLKQRLENKKALSTRLQVKQAAEERLRRFVSFLKQRMVKIKSNTMVCLRLHTYDDGVVFRTTRCGGRMTRYGCMDCETICACGAYKSIRQKYCSAYCKNVADNIC